MVFYMTLSIAVKQSSRPVLISTNVMITTVRTLIVDDSWHTQHKAAYTLANIMFANMFGKFIFPRTSCESGENDEPTAPEVI